MVCHFHADRQTRKSSSPQASVFKLMQDFWTIQSEISQSIDKAYSMNSSGLREALRQMLFLSLLQQTHIKTIKSSGRKDSGHSKGTRSSATKCRKTTSRSKPMRSSSSTETTSWLNVKPFPVTEAKPIAHTFLESSLNHLRELEECRRVASMRKRSKS